MSPCSCRAGMLLLLLGGPVLGQFAELATTDDGGQLYFTSSMLLKGARPSTWRESRVYRFAADGVTLYAERGALARTDEGSSSDGVSHPSVSDDGSVVGVSYIGVTGGDRVEIRGRETLSLGPGEVQISRNGKWALVDALGQGSVTLVELSSGQRTVVPLAPVMLGYTRQMTLASDGAFLAIRDTTRGIWKDGKFTPVPVPDDGLPVALSDDASTVFELITARGPVYNQLRAVSVATGAVTVVADIVSPDLGPIFLGASNDGRRVLYHVLPNRAPYLWDAATGSRTPIPLDPGEEAVDGVLSGNGAIAYIATTRARILRFDVASRSVSSLFPQTPYCDDPGPVAQGSFAILHCNFSSAAPDLAGKITLDDTPVPVLYSVAGEIGIQMPWKRNLFPGAFTYDVASASPFQGSQTVQVFDGAPEIVPDSRGLFGMKAVKGDWSGLLTALPAPGELFHVYMTGLGPTRRPESTGIPASDTPNPIEWKLTCGVMPSDAVEVVFAGLAPRMLGVYQVSFRMPELHVDRPPTGFRCDLVSPVMGVTFGPGYPRRGVYGSGSVIVVGVPPQ